MFSIKIHRYDTSVKLVFVSWCLIKVCFPNNLWRKNNLHIWFMRIWSKICHFKNFGIFICPPNGHIFIDLPSTRRRNSAWKLCQDFIDFERSIHVETMTSIRRGNFNIKSTFKIDEISTSFPPGLFYIVSMSNRHNFFTRCFLSIIFEHFLLWEPILN